MASAPTKISLDLDVFRYFKASKFDASISGKHCDYDTAKRRWNALIGDTVCEQASLDSDELTQFQYLESQATGMRFHDEQRTTNNVVWLLWLLLLLVIFIEVFWRIYILLTSVCSHCRDCLKRADSEIQMEKTLKLFTDFKEEHLLSKENQPQIDHGNQSQIDQGNQSQIDHGNQPQVDHKNQCQTPMLKRQSPGLPPNTKTLKTFETSREFKSSEVQSSNVERQSDIPEEHTKLMKAVMFDLFKFFTEFYLNHSVTTSSKNASDLTKPVDLSYPSLASPEFLQILKLSLQDQKFLRSTAASSGNNPDYTSLELTENPQHIFLNQDEHVLRYLAAADVCPQLHVYNVNAEINIHQGHVRLSGKLSNLQKAENKLNALIGDTVCEQASLDPDELAQFQYLEPQAITLKFHECQLVVGWCRKNNVIWLCSHCRDSLKRADTEIQTMLKMYKMISENIAISEEKLKYLNHVKDDEALMKEFNVKIDIDITPTVSRAKVFGLKAKVDAAVEKLDEVTSNYTVKCYPKRKIVSMCIKGINFLDIKNALKSVSLETEWHTESSNLMICSGTERDAEKAEKIISGLVSIYQYFLPGELVNAVSNRDWMILVKKLGKENIHLGEVDYKLSKVDFAYASQKDKVTAVKELDNFFKPLTLKTHTLPIATTNKVALYRLNEARINAACKAHGHGNVSINIQNQQVNITSYSNNSLTHAIKCIQSLKFWSKDFAVDHALVDWLKSPVGEKELEKAAATHAMTAMLSSKSTSGRKFTLKSVNGDISQMLVRLILCNTTYMY